MKTISAAVFALICSSQVTQSNALLDSLFKNFGSKSGSTEEGTIVTEKGDPDIGEIIYKPYHANQFTSMGKEIDADLSVEDVDKLENDPQFKTQMDEYKRTGRVSSNTPEGELLQWERNIHEENLQTVDYGKPVPRLDLN